MIDIFKESIDFNIRTDISVRHIGKLYDEQGNEITKDTILQSEKNGMRIKPYEIIQIAAGYDEDEIGTTFSDDICKSKISTSEEFVFINGDEINDIKGITSTTTIRNNLLEAINEFNPTHIITSCQGLDIPDDSNIKVVRSRFIDSCFPLNKVHFLYRKNPLTAEFVIQKDLHKDKILDNFVQWQECVAIEIHDPNAFIKVIET